MVLVLVCLSAAGGLSLFRSKVASLDTLELGVSLAPKLADDEPRNILIIGTDNADRLDPTDPVRSKRGRGGRLADVIMVARLEPRENRASLLSIPRDTWLPIAPFGDKGKINSAIAGSRGSENLIDTIKRDFGISIDNYVEVDFQGFRQLVAALDGIPVYLTVPVRDTEHTGLNLTETGCIVLDPVQALAYARSRHLQYKDPKTGKWVPDASSDLGRISRQQDFIERAAQRAVDRGARNPATALSLIDAATNAITIDNTMTVGQIRDLAARFGNFNVESLQKYQLPTGSGKSSKVSYQVVDWEQAEPILDVFRGLVYGREVTPRNVQVEIGPEAGPDAAAAISSALESHGFDTDVMADGDASGKRPAKTVIRFGARGREGAAVLARWLEGPARFTYDPDLPGARVHLVMGEDLKGVRSEPLPREAIEAPPLASATTTTVPGRRGATTTLVPQPGAPVTTAPPATPSTTVVGLVPIDPEEAAKCR